MPTGWRKRSTRFRRPQPGSIAARRRNKTLLQTAAVIGKDVAFGLLQALPELSDDASGTASAGLQG